MAARPLAVTWLGGLSEAGRENGLMSTIKPLDLIKDKPSLESLRKALEAFSRLSRGIAPPWLLGGLLGDFGLQKPQRFLLLDRDRGHLFVHHGLL